MGQRYILTDDLDESTDAVGTLTFFVDGQEHEIDLNEENMEHYTKLIQEHKAMLAELADYGRPVRRQSTLSAPRGRTKDQLDQIRRWARANGHEVSDRGRVPDKVIDAYETRNRMPIDTPEKNDEGGENGDKAAEVPA